MKVVLPTRSSCSVLQCVAVCYSVLQCVAVCYSVLQCVAMCCSVLQMTHSRDVGSASHMEFVCAPDLHTPMLCCSALQ